MADGEIIFSTALDNKQLEKQYRDLVKKIESLESKLHDAENARSPLIEQAKDLRFKIAAAKKEVDKYNQAWRSGVSGADKDASMAQERLAPLNAEYNSILEKIETYDTKISKINTDLDEQKSLAGGIIQQLSKAPKSADRMGDAVDRAGKYLDRFTERLKKLAVRALVFNVILQGLRSMRDWLWKSIKTNDQATAAVAKLKGALLTLAQPLVGVVIPAFTTFVNVLTEVITVLARLFAVIFGTTIDQSKAAAEALNDEKKALEGTGSAAKEAGKQLAGFDEINKLSGSNGGGGSSSSDIAPDFSFLKDSVLSNLAFQMEDILFNWSNLTAEDILAKIITGLTMVAGGIVGFTLGGPGGAVVGVLVGAGIGLAISNLTFDGDGKLSPEELLRTLVIALGMIAGVVIGFSVGGPGGAALGLLVGAGIALSVNKLLFNGDGRLSHEEILGTLLVALGAIAGGILGFTAGGPAGAVVGVLVGAGVGLAVKGLIFDGDGVLGQEEILSTLVTALGVIAGGIIGFMLGGPGGALIGAFVGAGIGLELGKLIFSGEGGRDNSFLQTLVFALGMLVGGIIGFTVGGPGGAVIGALVGAGAAMAIGALVFEWDGTQAVNKILSLLRDVLFMALGGVIGFALGGPGGAVLGMVIGAGINLAIKDVSFTDETENKKAGYDEGKLVGDNAISGTRDTLGTHSPSTEYEGIGGDMMLGMVNGVVNNQTLVFDAFGALLAEMVLMSQKSTDEMQALFVAFLTFFSGKFSSGWKSAAKDLSNSTRSIMNGIVSMFETGANLAIDSINSVIRAINKLIKASPLAAMAEFGTSKVISTVPSVSVGRIPALARGAVIPPNREFLAVLGDQKSGNNIEAPEGLIRKIVREETAGNGGGRMVTVVLELDKRQFGKATFDAYNMESGRIGLQLQKA